MKVKTRIAAILIFAGFMSGCETTTNTPSLQNPNFVPAPTAYEQNQEKLQSSVYQ